MINNKNEKYWKMIAYLRVLHIYFWSLISTKFPNFYDCYNPSCFIELYNTHHYPNSFIPSSLILTICFLINFHIYENFFKLSQFLDNNLASEVSFSWFYSTYFDICKFLISYCWRQQLLYQMSTLMLYITLI